MKIFPTIAALTSLALAACQGEQFSVEGTITSADDSLLYFEQMTLQGSITLDSTRLDKQGNFSFSAERPDAPEFYRLRIDRQVINICIDSTETVAIKADWPTMATEYEVSGSPECEKIKELARMQVELQRRVVAIGRNGTLTPREASDSINALIGEHKRRVTTDYIFRNPAAPSSYFALFQAVGPYLVFNPRTDAYDLRVLAAVATSWETYYPEATRTENLHNIAIAGMRDERIARADNTATIDPEKVHTSGIIDFSLTDNNGKEHSLSGLKGKVVMLDFHLFALQDSPQRILALRELYNKFHARGFEIYQVSIDPDEHFWKQQTEALPWICVRDDDGAASPRLATYNVTSVPEFFLIDRDNNIVSRSTQVDDVAKAIEELLGE